MSGTIGATELNDAINSLGATAIRIADERRDLLVALRNVINAADIHGTSSGEYDLARLKAIRLLQRMQS